MNTHSNIDDSSRAKLLLESSANLVQMITIAQATETHQGTRLLYSHLALYCLRFQLSIRQMRQNLHQPNKDVVKKTLLYLSSLVSDDGLRVSPGYTTTVEFRLKAFNLNWSEMQRQSDDRKADFIRGWLKTKASEERSKMLDKVLEECADTFDKQTSGYSDSSPREISTSPRISKPPETVWKTAQSIFNALVNSKACSCTNQHEVGAKLELHTYNKSKEATEIQPSRIDRRHRPCDNELEFDMFLSMGERWQEVCVRAIRERVVDFKVGDVQPQSNGGNVTRRSKKVQDLCTTIASIQPKSPHCLALRLDRDELFQEPVEKSKRRINKEVDPISLSRCFQERREFFTEKTKRILSLILSHMVLHLHATSWIQTGWGSTSIKFFQTIARKTPLRPFVQTQLPKVLSHAQNPEHQSIVDCGDDVGSNDSTELLEDARHGCPALVSLAAVLMEIHSVETFAKLAEMYHVQLMEESSSRVSFIDVSEVFNGDPDMGQDGWRSQIPQDSPLLDAIKHCLASKWWEYDAYTPLDNATLTSRIYQLVVQPLELHLASGFGQIPLDGIDNYARQIDLGNWGQAIPPEPGRHTVAMTSAALASSSSSLAPIFYIPGLNDRNPTGQSNLGVGMFHSLSGYPSIFRSPDFDHISHPGLNTETCQFFDDVKDDREHNAVEKYRKWRLRYEKVYEKFFEKRSTDKPSIPVRIAILDTGIDRDHDYINAREANVKGRHNCYGDSQRSVVDRNGHGTFAANLILDYAPDAELYIIKIADGNVRPEARLVAEAINHALEKWDVDIISMSFGWPSSEFDGFNVLEKAIDEAYNRKVLMFAAAANSGGNCGRAYPASSSQVICVHSTDTDGNRSSFSPTAQASTLNFATVGESVESAWPTMLCHEGEKVKTRSGTSYATPIIVGIAASLLRYARLHLDENQAKRLKRKERIEALLQRCAVRGSNYQQRDGYYYVELSVQSHNLFGQDLKRVNHEFAGTLIT